MGRRYGDEVVQQHKKSHPHTDIIQKDGNPFVEVLFKSERQAFSPEEISSFILEQMKTTVLNYAGGGASSRNTEDLIESAIITVPAYFQDPQRTETKEAAELAGLKVSAIINEPMAAAIAYGVQARKYTSKTPMENVLVFDLGGGTLDVTVLQTDGKTFQAKAHGGNGALGGEEFDECLQALVLKKFEENSPWKHGQYPNNIKPKNLLWLLAECKEAKESFLCEEEYEFFIEAFHEDTSLHVTVSRDEFESECSHLFDQLIPPLESVIADSNLEKGEIDSIVLVGGSSYLRKVQDIVSSFFNGKELMLDINRTEAIAEGATLHAASLSSNIFNEERVSDEGNIHVTDAIAHSLGLQTRGDIMSKLITANTQLPAHGAKTFTNNGSNLYIDIYQGEDVTASNNTHLGRFEITSSGRLAPRSVRLRVEFNLSNEGQLSVSAKDVCDNGISDILSESLSWRFSLSIFYRPSAVEMAYANSSITFRG